jgi:hypothetical protein
MKNFIYFILLLFSLPESCTPPIDSTSSPVHYVNIRDYYPPAVQLFQPRVYCYADSMGIIKKYQVLQASVEGSDTFVTTLDYDSSFTPKIREKDLWSESGATSVEFATIQSGRDLPIQINSGFMAWQQPLQSDSNSYHLTYNMQVSTHAGTILVSGNFDRLLDSSLAESYPVADCISNPYVYQILIDGSSVEGKPEIEHNVNYYARGIGIIFYTDQGTKYFLQKIISSTEFDRLRRGNQL